MTTKTHASSSRGMSSAVKRKSLRRHIAARTTPLAEQLENRRLFFNTYVGQGDSNARLGATNVEYSYSNLLDNAANWAVGLSRVDMQNAIEEAMGVWTSVSPLRFFQVADSGPAPSDNAYVQNATPTIRWGHHFIDGQPTSPPFLNTLAHAYRPSNLAPSSRNGLSSDTHFDNGNTWTINQLMETGAHEFGHAIGLTHANGDVTGTPPVCPGPGPNGPAVMDACAGSFNYNGLESAFLLPDDIAGIRSLYGTGLGYVIDSFGEMNVYGTRGNDLLSVDISGGNITVTSSIVGGAFTGSFTRAINDGQTTVNSIQLHGLDGDDILRVENTGGRRANLYGGAGDDFFDIGVVRRNFEGLGETQIFAGAGNDTLFAYDNFNAGGQSYNVTSTRFDRSGWGGARFFDDLESRMLTTGNTANVVTIFNTSTNRRTIIQNGGGADTVNIGTNNSMQQIQGYVEIQNDPSFTTVNLNNAADTVARTVTVNQLPGNFGVVSGLAPADIAWDNADVGTINLNTGTQADVVNVLRASEKLNLFNAAGRDRITLGNSVDGMNNVTEAVRLELSPTAFTFPDLLINDAGTNTGRNLNWTKSGNRFTITGLPGAVSYENVSAFNYLGGRGNDVFTLANIDDNSIILNGGDGYDVFTADDRAHPLPFVTSDIRADAFERTTGGLFGTAIIWGYTGMESVNFYLAPNVGPVNVSGVPSSIPAGSQMTVFGNAAANAITLVPRDPAGNLTINGNIGIVGGDGVDTLTIEDAASAIPVDYRLANPFGSGTQNVFGLSANPGTGLGTALIETIRINAGAGNDTFALDQYTSGVALEINAGAGDDAMEVGNGNVRSNITAIGAFTYNGQDGSDSLTVDHTATNAEPFTYVRDTAFVRIANALGGYAFRIQDPNVEQTFVNSGGGVGSEFMEVIGMRPGTRLDVYMAAGTDVLRLGRSIIASPDTLEAIQGTINYIAGDAGGRVEVWDTSDITGDVFHLTQGTLGAVAGDTLFGPGGSLSFAGIGDLSAIALAMVIHCGSGSDIAYATPLVTGSTRINFNSKGARGRASGDETGDMLNLALAGAANYVVTEETATSGVVVSDSTGELRWTGLDGPPAIDDVAPSALAGDYLFDTSVSALSFTFNEDVVATLSLASLSLIDLATGDAVYTGDFLIDYDTSTSVATISFPNLPRGSLADGDYRATLEPGFSDVFGNAAQAALSFDFFVLAGDANRDRAVNFADLVILAQNYNQSDRTFSRGNFDYSPDGRVDFADLVLLAQRYNSALPSGISALLAAGRKSGTLSSSFREREVVEIKAIAEAKPPRGGSKLTAARSLQPA